jgi:4-amino-4-deoxy-L-arabinose transferase-like glycosyltransferase
MMQDATPLAVPRRPWYAEREAIILLLLAVALYLPRLTTLTIRGEESRRAVIAREMWQSGDWIVPRTQGVVRVSRPPLQNWLIAGVALLRGEVDAWAIRLPGLLCTVATVLLVYWAARRQLGRTGAFVAGAAYASLLQVLEQAKRNRW